MISISFKLSEKASNYRLEFELGWITVVVTLTTRSLGRGHFDHWVFQLLDHHPHRPLVWQEERIGEKSRHSPHSCDCPWLSQLSSPYGPFQRRSPAKSKNLVVGARAFGLDLRPRRIGGYPPGRRESPLRFKTSFFSPVLDCTIPEWLTTWNKTHNETNRSSFLLSLPLFIIIQYFLTVWWKFRGQGAAEPCPGYLEKSITVQTSHKSISRNAYPRTLLPLCEESPPSLHHQRVQKYDMNDQPVPLWSSDLSPPPRR